MPQSTERLEQLEAIKRLLNTPDGDMLLDELEVEWDSFRLMGDDPYKTAYKVGMRDAFRFLIALKQGDFIDEQ